MSIIFVTKEQRGIILWLGDVEKKNKIWIVNFYFYLYLTILLEEISIFATTYKQTKKTQTRAQHNNTNVSTFLINHLLAFLIHLKTCKGKKDAKFVTELILFIISDNFAPTTQYSVINMLWFNVNLIDFINRWSLWLHNVKRCV